MSTPRPTIALVDDDKIYQFTSVKALQLTNAAGEILQFMNGDEALQFLKEKVEQPDELPDIIFLDINMPITDGWMFMDEFVKLKGLLPKSITVYMVSSSIDPRDINKANSIKEIAEYVPKPVSIETFSKLLQI